jgi:hypothetical protein
MQEHTPRAFGDSFNLNEVIDQALRRIRRQKPKEGNYTKAKTVRSRGIKEIVSTWGRPLRKSHEEYD